MYYVRDRQTLEVITWGTDKTKCATISGSSERYELREDIGARGCYKNTPLVGPPMRQMHMYDYTAHLKHQAELKVLMDWHKAGGNR